MIRKSKDTVYIATISGGKDSVTMCDLLLKNGYPVDEILFSDTLEEFKEMYIYIEKVKLYIKERYKKDITILKPKAIFEDWAFGTIEKEGAKRIGQSRGIPTKGGMCWWRREAKVVPMDKYIQNKYKGKKIVSYIGYTKGENRSVQDTENQKFIYPLKDIFMMTEEDCKQYLINQEMENPLYRHFSRTGCAFCPFQSDKSFFMIWKHYPDVWERMKYIENNLEILDKKNGVINKHWFSKNMSILEKEKEFREKDIQGSLFDFSDEPLQDCFCKI